MKKCRQCGFKNVREAQFCENCASSLKYAKNKNMKFIITSVIIVLVAIIAGLVLVFSDSDTKKYNNKLEVAQKYVEQLDYEKAEDAYEDAYLEAIDIDPKQTQAYIELADVYEAEDKVDQSIQILEKGIQNVSNTDKKEIEKKLDEIKNRT